MSAASKKKTSSVELPAEPPPPKPPPPDAARRASAFATIQSDSKGQFGDLLAQCERSPDFPSLLSHFASLSTAESRVALLLRRCLGHVQPREVFRRKDRRAAEQAREEGNRSFARKDFGRARAEYSRSVVCAPQDDSQGTELLAVALANRSACSLHLKDYGQAIADIHYALALNYPKGKRSKLYLRLCKCHQQLGQLAKARPILRIALSLLGDEPSAQEQDSRQSKEIRDLSEALELEMCERRTEKGKLEEGRQKKTDSFATSAGTFL